MKKGFTMAEILLSLTIIGVVAAITLPSLTGNINERTWNTQRKALYARFSQALPLMDALNGYGTLTEATSSASAIDNVAETFVTAGLSKVLKINNICSEKLKDCGVPEKITTLKGNTISTPTTLQMLNSHMVGTKTNNTVGAETFTVKNSKAAAFETQNGESVIVYYNPDCSGTLGESASSSSTNLAGYFYIQRRICANFIYDLNGLKGPNTVGKDIGFMTAMYPFDAQLYAPYPAVSPFTFTGDTSISTYSKQCTNRDGDYRSPNVGELVSMFVNRELIDYSAYDTTTYISTERVVNNGRAIYMGISFADGREDDFVVGGEGLSGWCVKR